MEITSKLGLVSHVGVDGCLDLLAVLIKVVRVLALGAYSTREHRSSRSHDRDLTFLTAPRLEEGTQHRLSI